MGNMNWMSKLDELDKQNTPSQLTETIRHLSHVIVVTTTHEQNIICGKTHLDCTTHEHTIIFTQLFACHVVQMGKGRGKKYGVIFSPPQPPTPPLHQPSTGQAIVTIQDEGIEPIYLAIASRSEITPALQAR